MTPSKDKMTGNYSRRVILLYSFIMSTSASAATLRGDIFPTESSYSYIDYVLSLLKFAASYQIVSIAECKLPPRPNTISLNIGRNETKFVELTCDSDLLQN